MQITLDRERSRVEYFSFSQAAGVLLGRQAKWETLVLEATDIPAVAVWPAGMRLQSIEGAVCDQLSSFAVHYDSLKTGGWHELTDYSCTANGLLSIKFDR